MRASFKLSLLIDDELIELMEAELDARFDSVIEHLRTAEVIEGAVLLTGPRMRDFTIADEMVPLIRRFCFESIITLLERKQETYVYYFFNCGSLCVFVSARGEITLLSDDDQEDMSTIRCEQNELLPALYHCGVRYIELLQRLQREGRQDDRSLQQLTEAADDARRVLIAHSLLPG